MPDLAELPLTELVGWWRSLPAKAGRTRVLAVDGRSGSGKTTLAADLAALAPDAVSRSIEDVYPGWDGLAAAIGLVVHHLLEPLATGRSAGLPRWDWAAGAPGGWHAVRAAPVLLLLEGVGAGARACAPYLSGLLWVEAPADLRRRRALSRDGDTFAPHWERWAAQEEEYLRSHDPAGRADVIVDGARALPRAATVPVLVDRRTSSSGPADFGEEPFGGAG